MQYDKIGKFIKQKRLAIGLSLNRFAIDCDVDSAIISRIENCKQNVKLNVLEKIAAKFGQTPSEFLNEFENYLS